MKAFAFAIAVFSLAAQVTWAQEIVVINTRRGPVAKIDSSIAGTEMLSVLSKKNLSLNEGRLTVTDFSINEDGGFQFVKGHESMTVDLQNGVISISGLYKLSAESGDMSNIPIEQQKIASDLIENGLNLNYSLSSCSSVILGAEVFVNCRKVVIAMTDTHQIDLNKLKEKPSETTQDRNILISFSGAVLSKNQPNGLKNLAGRSKIEFKSFDDQSVGALPEEMQRALQNAGMISDNDPLDDSLGFNGFSVR